MAKRHSSSKKRPERSPKPAGPLELRNPHSVLAVLESRPEDVVELRLHPDRVTPAWQRVVEAAARTRRPVKPPKSSGEAARDDRRATLATALVRPKPEERLARMLDDSTDPGLWLALEHVQDPHNLGAIVRTAAFFGVRGLILMKDQSASLTPIAYDIAAGGVEAMPHCVVTNMSRTLDAAKNAGLWIVGTSEHADAPLRSLAPDRRWLVVVGNEEHGLRRLTKEKCDVLVGIPCAGDVTSLNVSVATGIVLSHLSVEPTENAT